MVSELTVVETEGAGSPAADRAICASCNRIIKDPAEWVRSGKKTMCVDCYEGLLNPFWKCCTGELA